MAGKVLKKFLKFVFYLTSILLILLSIIGIATQTEIFRNAIRNYIISELNKNLNAEVKIGKFYGGLFTGLGVDGVEINVEAHPFVKIFRLEVRYNPLGFLRGSISFHELRIFKPEVFIFRGKDGKWNFEKIAKKREKKGEAKFKLQFGKLLLEDGKFVFVDSLKMKRASDSFDFHNFSLSDINLKFGGTIGNDVIELKNLSASVKFDKNNLIISVSGKFFANEKIARVENFEITTDSTHAFVNLSATTPENLFKLDSAKIRKVYFTLNFNSPNLCLQEVAKFIPKLKIFSGTHLVNIKAEGTLEQLNITKARVKIFNSEFLATGKVLNVGDFQKLFIQVNLESSRVKVADVKRFINKFHFEGLKVEEVTLDGEASGSPLDFNSKINLRWDRTKISVDGNFKFGSKLVYNLNVKADSLNPEDLTGISSLKGEVFFSGGIAGEGTSPDSATARANLGLKRSIVGNYIIPESNLWVELKNGEIFGTLVSFSDALKGIIDFGLGKNGTAKFVNLSASLTELDVGKLTYGDVFGKIHSHISGEFSAKVEINEISKAEIYAQLNPSTFGNYKIKRLRLNARYSDERGKKNLLVQSNMFDMHLDGDFKFNVIVSAFKNIVGLLNERFKERFYFAEANVESFTGGRASFDYRFKFKNLTPLSLLSTGQIFNAFGNLNGTFISDSTWFYSFFSADLRDIFYIKVGAQKVDTIKMAHFDGSVELSGEGEIFRFKMSGGAKNFESGNFVIKTAKANIIIDDKKAYFEIFADGEKWQINGVGDAESSKDVNRYAFSDIVLNFSGNSLRNESAIEIYQTKSGWLINPLVLNFNGEKVNISGFIDPQGQQIRIWGENLNLRKLGFVKYFDGVADFSILIYGVRNEQKSEIELSVKNLQYKSANIGDLFCYGKMESGEFEVSSYLEMKLGDTTHHVMDIDLRFPAWFIPNSKHLEKFVRGKVKFSRFPIAVIEPLIPDFSDVSGEFTAELNFGGTIEEPRFDGDFLLQNCTFKFIPNRKYYLAYGRGRVISNVIYLDEVNLWNNPEDFKDGEVQIAGEIRFDGYRLAGGNLNINGKLLILDKEGWGFTGLYGRTVASTGGNGLRLKIDTAGISLSGEIHLMNVDLNFIPRYARTGVGRSSDFEYVYVQPAETAKVSEQFEELVQFEFPKSNGDTSANRDEKERKGFMSRISFDLKILTAEEANFTLILNSQTGEKLVLVTNGSVDLRNYGGQMLAYGVVELLDRSYYYFFKKFDATGKVKFTGNIQDPELEIRATYTGTHTVLTDTVGVEKVEMVQVVFVITGTISKPSVKIEMYVDGNDYAKVYPHGDVETDAVSFLVTGRFREELSRIEVAGLAENLWTTAGSSLLTEAVTGVITDVLRDVLGGFIMSTELAYSPTLKGLRITGKFAGATIQIGGNIFTDISQSTVSIQYPLLRKTFGDNFIIEFQRKPSMFYHEKEIVNQLKLLYKVKL